MGQRGEYSHVPEKRRSPGDQAAQHEHHGRKGGGEGIRCSSLIRSPSTGARFDWVGPVALGHHRYEWLYVTAFVAPSRGETVWYLSNGLDKPFFAKLLEVFARETG